MSGTGLVFLLIAVVYLFGTLFEIPFVFENPKSKWIVDKIGKKQTKILFIIIAVIFFILACKFK